MPGPAPKKDPAGHAHRKPLDIVTHDDHLPVIAPEAPAGLLASSRDAWNAIWSSPLARTYDINTDGLVLRRYIDLVDERERMSRAVKKDGRMVMGSKGQNVLNPLIREMGTIDAELRQLEDRLGLSPLARMRLGIALGDAARSLDDLNAALAVDIEDDEPDIRVVSG